VDLAVVGKGRGVQGDGVLATVSFKAIGNGDPKIRIEAVDGRGTHNEPLTIASSREATVPLPTATLLQSAMPNPFRETVSLAVDLAQRSNVNLSIYSVDGRKVRTLTSGVLEAGAYPFVWDGRDANGSEMKSGIYYARLIAGSARFTRRLTLLR